MFLCRSILEIHSFLYPMVDVNRIEMFVFHLEKILEVPDEILLNRNL